jgi:hypothetical protein
MTVCARIYHSTKLSLETSLSPEELEVQAAQILANRAERKRVASRAVYAQAKSNDPEALQVKSKAKSRKHAEENPCLGQSSWRPIPSKGQGVEEMVLCHL